MISTHIVSRDEVKSAFAKLRASSVVGIDFETTGPNITWPIRGKGQRKTRPNVLEHLIAGVSVWGDSDPTTSLYFPCRHKGVGGNLPGLLVRALVDELLSWAPTKELWFWNLGYELQICRNEGIFYGDRSDQFRDAQVLTWLAGWGRQPKLKQTAEKRFPELAPLADFAATFGKNVNMADFTSEEVAAYAGKDPWLTCKLAAEARPVVEARGLWEHFLTLEMPLVESLRDMHAHGWPRNRSKLEALRDAKTLEAEAAAAEFKARTTCPVPVTTREPVVCLGEDGAPILFKSGKRKGEVKCRLEPVTRVVERGADVGNDHEVSQWLYDHLKVLPTAGVRKNGNDEWPVDKDTLELLPPGPGRELADIVLRYRRAAKLVSTYLDVLIDLPDQYADGRVHPSFHLTGTLTQRLSSSGPNGQNMPAHSEAAEVIMDALEAPEGWSWVIFDESQIELRIMAHVSQDPALLEAYTWGTDVHARTLAAIQKVMPTAKRVNAKITNFCLDPDVPVLMSDLRWRSAGSIRPGDKLVAFDESLGAACRYRETEVEAVTELEAECFEVVTDVGSVIASADHLWVADKMRGPRYRSAAWRGWVRTADLVSGQRLAHMVAPWSDDDTRDAGWLAGFFDGEGSVSVGGSVTFGQNLGPTRLHAEALLRAKGFDFHTTKNTGGNCHQSRLRGPGENLRFCGQIRPERLLVQRERLWLGKRPYGPHTQTVRVREIRPLGRRKVVGHQTRHRTLIAGGFLSHNSTIYQITAASLAVKLRCTEAEAQVFIDAFYEAQPGVAAYQTKVERFLAANGYAPTIDGFRRYFEFAKRRDGSVSPKALREAISTSIQGSAGGIIKLAQRNLHQHWRESGEYLQRVHFAGQIHDSLICAARDDFAQQCAADMEKYMTSAVKLRVPLEVDGGVGKTWKECK